MDKEERGRSKRERVKKKRASQKRRARQKSEWWQRYNRYLNSPEWRVKRQLVLERDSGECQDCGTAAEHVHHLTYKRVFEEALEDLVALCAGCHEGRHDRGTKPKSNRDEWIEMTGGIPVKGQTKKRRKRALKKAWRCPLCKYGGKKAKHLAMHLLDYHIEEGRGWRQLLRRPGEKENVYERRVGKLLVRALRRYRLAVTMRNRAAKIDAKYDRRGRRDDDFFPKWKKTHA